MRKFIKFGPVQRKALLLLSAGVALGLARSPKRYFRIIRDVGDEWRAIDRRSLDIAIRLLYRSKLVETRPGPNDSLTLVLSEQGKKIALSFDIERMQLKRHAEWDGKWRIVLFDIPEKLKKVRDIVRFRLRQLGFVELQHSVWVTPHPCKKEIEYVIEFYDMRKYVRFITAIDIDNALHLERTFGLRSV
jgi:DNA-binding transcriptional regulator PaaX